MALVDVHVHLPSYGDAREVIRTAEAQGSRLVSCTVDASEAERNLGYGEEHPSVWSFLGVHPSNVSGTKPSEALGAMWQVSDGVGEIGLDAKYSEAGEGSLQDIAFRDQLEAAERHGKPVEVHSRGSERRCLDVLSSYRPKAVLLHWFQGEDDLGAVVDRGYYVSFGPALLYSKKLRRIASRMPEERLLTESDGPVGYDALGGASGPSLIASVVFTLACARQVSYGEMEATVEANAAAFMGKKTVKLNLHAGSARRDG